ncbi:hypothetical protein QVN42_16070 [Yersinia nurmii]|uniref:Membrane protein n=1 Tax=Yersinia nurmii TaxID=685706 RepID=A0AAW7K4A0_9GAMM|nr:hypothetical protein [Yersinia nurmii]MDN0088871.1 hypothetical protein [Yersinia nurmii]CNF08019.1 membrane protein [Yersinia nurmii]
MHKGKTIRLNGNIVFDTLQRSLATDQKKTRLSENESRLLQMLLEKTCEKREILYTIWESRGVIVTDSSYYKLIKQLRQSFVMIGENEDPIMTLPRIGVRFVGTQEEFTPTAPSKIRILNIINYVKLKIASSFFIIAAILFSFDFISI